MELALERHNGWKPNLLWLYAEDLSPWFSAYGDDTVETPNLDRLAREGVVFENCYAPSPVCSPARSSNILGCSPIEARVHSHRSSRTPFDPNPLPSRFVPLPQLLKRHGYRSFNFGKDDFNFQYDWKDLYDNSGIEHFHWKEGQFSEWPQLLKVEEPFFAQIQLLGGKSAHSCDLSRLLPSLDALSLPPYYPDHPVFREQYAEHYACVRQTDLWVGEILDALDEAGKLEATQVFFLSDHGMEGLRHKQFCYEGGLKVPMIFRAGNKVWPAAPRGTRRRDLVASYDIYWTSLGSLGFDCGHRRQDWFSDSYVARDCLYSARDRCDFSLDGIRSVSDGRYRYIRNYFPDRPWLQASYRSDWLVERTWRELEREGVLDAASSLFLAETKPVEELYDLSADPHQIDNLAGTKEAAPALNQMRERLKAWQLRVDDPLLSKLCDESDLLAALARWKEQCVDEVFEPVRTKYAGLLSRYPEQRPWVLDPKLSPRSR